MAPYICSAGNGANPTSTPFQLGAVSEAPLQPHLEHLAERRSRSLEASPPHLIIRGASAVGALCRHFVFSQLTQVQQASLRIC